MISPTRATIPERAAASITSPTPSIRREDVLRAADIFLENGVYIETGPHKHAIQQTFFLYVYEPGGNRVEVANAGARLILAPDWKPIVWTEEERKKGQAWGLKTIESFHTYGTPPVDVAGTLIIADTRKINNRINERAISVVDWGETQRYYVMVYLRL